MRFCFQRVSGQATSNFLSRNTTAPGSPRGGIAVHQAAVKSRRRCKTTSPDFLPVLYRAQESGGVRLKPGPTEEIGKRRRGAEHSSPSGISRCEFSLTYARAGASVSTTMRNVPFLGTLSAISCRLSALTHSPETPPAPRALAPHQTALAVTRINDRTGPPSARSAAGWT